MKESHKFCFQPPWLEIQGAKLAALMEKFYDLYEPADEDEKNAYNIDITEDMSVEDVIEKVLKTVENISWLHILKQIKSNVLIQKSPHFALLHTFFEVNKFSIIFWPSTLCIVY